MNNYITYETRCSQCGRPAGETVCPDTTVNAWHARCHAGNCKGLLLYKEKGSRDPWRVVIRND